MKLIIREYLASLRERKELDALLPDLLSQMGMEVFSKPSIGNRQYGVDVAAYGKLGDEEEKVYLFSIKSGDLGRNDWNSGSVQDLQPSLDEIRDAYIPMLLPSEYKDKQIEICICFGGDLKENVRGNISAYENKYSTEQLSFGEWGGERLASYVEKYLLKEELLPVESRQYLRKSLAMLDEPDISFKHFQTLVAVLCDIENKQPKEILTSIRQLYICLWILYSWCREGGNIESAYLSSELSLLNSWEISKSSFERKDKVSKSILETLSSIQLLNQQISTHYVESIVTPHASNLYAVSSAVRSSCSVDVNLKLFDVLGRLALSGCWSYWYLSKFKSSDPEAAKIFSQDIYDCQKNIKQLIINNPILFCPYKDEQAIDIMMAVWVLSLDESNWRDIHAWLLNMSNQIYFLFQTDGIYPSTIQSYNELIEHPVNDMEGYRESVTKGSVLYPFISVISAILGFDDVYSIMKKIKQDYLEHCNYQAWFLDDTSEKYLYKFNNSHGGTLSNIGVDKEPAELLDEIFGECEISNHFYNTSAIKYSNWPLIFVVCRHYRLPIPMHFLLDLHNDISAAKNKTESVG